MVCDEPEIVRMFIKEEFYIEGITPTDRITPCFNTQGDSNDINHSMRDSHYITSRLRSFDGESSKLDHPSTSNNIPLTYLSPQDNPELDNEQIIDKDCMSYLNLSP